MDGQINPPMLVRYRDGAFANCAVGIRTLVFNLVPRYNGRTLTLDFLTFQVESAIASKFSYELITEEFSLENGTIILSGRSERNLDLPRYKISFSRNIALYVTNLDLAAYDVTAAIEGQIDF